MAEVYFEITSSLFNLVLLIMVLTDKSQTNISRRCFKINVANIFLATLIEIVTVIITTLPFLPYTKLVMHSLDFICNASVAFLFGLYVCTYASKTPTKTIFWNLNITFFVFDVFIIALNFFTPFIMGVTEEGVYYHGPLYIHIGFCVPAVFLLFSIIMYLSCMKRMNKRRNFAIQMTYLVVIAGGVLQGISDGDILICLPLASVGLYIIYFSMESPDYQRLLYTLEELKVSREKEMLANNVKDEFLTNMSHELRTPIQAVLGYSDLILKDEPDLTLRHYAKCANESGQSLLSMVENIQDFSSILDEKLSLESEPYSMTTLVESMCLYAKELTMRKGLKLYLHIDEKIPSRLIGDGKHIEQIIRNLLSNAAKYTKEGFNDFTVSWKNKEGPHGVLKVSVADSGIGMRPADVMRIEEAFTRFDIRNTRNIEGIGLGMTLVSRLLKMMNSSISVQSEVGLGSNFSFELEQDVDDITPIGKIVLDSDSSAKNENSNYELLQFMQDTKALIVDDNEMNMELISELLKRFGLQTFTASNGHKAIEMLRHKKFDIIFMDYMMPVLTGGETLKVIRKERLCPDTPVIVLTANAVEGAKNEYMSEGFTAYMTKPVEMDKLKTLLQRLLPHKAVHLSIELVDERR
ncbi:MAG: response regulator [Treponema sp.]|nr:response regulator [Treponema sp.]